MRHLVFLCLLAASCFSCQTTGYFIQDSNMPVSDTRKHVTALFGRPRALSTNGRELYSSYHDAKFNYLFDSTNVQERYFTKVTILGPRRPYEVQVQVFEEKYELESDAFVNVGVDEDLSFRRALVLQKAMKETLTSSQTLDGDLPF
jgi:hypothetical protein